MLFNSLAFAVFLPLVYALYWGLGAEHRRAQNALIVVGSYVFYGWWDWRFLSIIFVSSAVDYGLGLQLHVVQKQNVRRLLLLCSLVLNLGVLGVVKYYDFFATSLTTALAKVGWTTDPVLLRLILPVGISFYTFQTLSYTLDCYRQKLAPTRDAIAFFAFVSFFPQLVAGPIERAAHLLPQFLRHRRFDPLLARAGLRLMLLGFLKKSLVADNIAPHVDQIFAHSAAAEGLVLPIGAFLFAIQIYCDFSGYSDIAIGCASLFGFELSTNFNFPYFSRSIGEFWRRWHISLSTWFRDYVYIPLGGGRVSPGRRCLNIVVVFAVSGLWHGANWTYVVWGMLHALYYLPEAFGARLRMPRTWWADALRIGTTFAATCVAWVFFRSATVGEAYSYCQRLFTSGLSRGFPGRLLWPLMLAAGLLAAEGLALLLRRRQTDWTQVALPWRWAMYYGAVILLCVGGSFGETPFIYFQF